MSQFGMQMPGGGKSKPPLTIYTGLLFVAVACLATATYFAFEQASLVAPEKGPAGAIKLQQEGSVQLPNADLNR